MHIWSALNQIIQQITCPYQSRIRTWWTYHRSDEHSDLESIAQTNPAFVWSGHRADGTSIRIQRKLRTINDTSESLGSTRVRAGPWSRWLAQPSAASERGALYGAHANALNFSRLHQAIRYLVRIKWSAPTIFSSVFDGWTGKAQ